MSEYVVALTDETAADPMVAGGKASRLAELLRLGFPVPPGFVVTAAAFRRAVAESDGDAPQIPDVIRASVAQAVDAHQGPFAVRSSATAEDLEGASFAGQYETFLNVERGELEKAIGACWASASALRVRAYRSRRGMSGDSSVAVLVQSMVAATAAGVAFTMNPRTGERETVINAVRGLGDRLVGGEVTAEEWIVRAGAATMAMGRGDVLSTNEALAVDDLARRVDVHYGAPQDIEWALSGHTVCLLQARPATAIPGAVAWEAPHPGLWLRRFRLGEWLGAPLTPLFDTWLLSRIEDRLFEAMEGVVPQGLARPYHVTANGWYFTTGNFTPRSVPHALYLAVWYLLPAAILRPTEISVLTTRWAHIGMAHFERLWRRGFKATYERAVRDAEARVESCDVLELIPLIDTLADQAGREAFYFFLGGGSAWKCEAALAAFYRAQLRSRPSDTHQTLLRGLSGAAVSQPHAVLSLDWHEPTLSELGLEPDEASLSERRQQVLRERREAEVAARARLGHSEALLRRFDVLLERAQHFGRLREEQASHLTLAWPVLRKAVQRLGETLTERGLLRDRDDVFFLFRSEVEQALEPGGTPRTLRPDALRRREAWQRQARLSPPDHLGSMSFIQRAIFAGAERSLSGTRASKPVGSQVRGAPASPGRATGRARVVLSAVDFSRLGDGDILVAPATNPGWTPLFVRARGVVTDAGSLMAHASLVAREYGIPAVVGCGDATKRICDGQIITVDGTTGIVETTE